MEINAKTTSEKKQLLQKHAKWLKKLSNETGEDKISSSTLPLFRYLAKVGRYDAFLESLSQSKDLFYEYASLVANYSNAK